MYQIDGLTNYQRVHGQGLADAQPLPRNTDWQGPAVDLSGTMGAIEVVVRAHDALAIANGKMLTVKLQQAGADGIFADLATVVSRHAAAGNGAIAKNTELGRFALPSDVKQNLRAEIETDDDNATGELDVIPIYLPR